LSFGINPALSSDFHSSAGAQGMTSHWIQDQLAEYTCCSTKLINLSEGDAVALADAEIAI
jgi:hypothetical protein